MNMRSDNAENIQNIEKKLARCEECAWINPKKLPFDRVDGLSQLVVSDADIADAETRLSRFAPFIKKRFPETEATDGIIESPLREIAKMKSALEDDCAARLSGRLLLKMDSHLAVSGSVKARGGIYEVLKHAEDIAVEAGLLSYDDDYGKLTDMKDFFSDYTVQVGSTGNLGMSIGIMSAALGFKVRVHMSADAKEWKKALLRARGVEVIEYADDYSRAVAEGRRLSDSDPKSYFVDDERSKDLFLGYATAANRLKKQLKDMNIAVDENNPLFVYLPAGVGGAPGGIAYGLKRIYGDLVHCFFVEPTLYPSVLLGISTGKFEKASVRDIGLNGLSAADGLACPSPSGLVTRLMTNHLSGEITVRDERLFDYMRMLYSLEDIVVEPSGCAAFAGVCGFMKYSEMHDYCQNNDLDGEKLRSATHIAWATGGSMIPDEEKNAYLLQYKR